MYTYNYVLSSWLCKQLQLLHDRERPLYSIDMSPSSARYVLMWWSSRTQTHIVNKNQLKQYHVWLKLVQWFLRRNFFNFVNVFLLFHNYLPLEKGGPFIWTNLNPLHPRMLSTPSADLKSYLYTVYIYLHINFNKSSRWGSYIHVSHSPIMVPLLEKQKLKKWTLKSKVKVSKNQ